MLEFAEGSDRTLDGTTRRTFLHLASVSALGLGFSPLRNSCANPIRRSEDKACILIWLQGGLSHLDSFDPKPDACEQVRGEFRAISTRLPGIQFSEHLPKLAAIHDKFSVVRSLNPKNGSHGVSDAYVMSGHPFVPSLAFPCYGSVVSHQLGPRSDIPAFVQLGDSLDSRFGGGGGGFLGSQVDPWIHRTLEGSAPGKSTRQADLMGGRDSRTDPPESLRSVVDLAGERDRLRAKYGQNSLGQSCLRARRLVESGARFVTVTDSGWDTHENGFDRLSRELLPRLDGAVSALIEDLEARDLLDSTLLVVLTDFGRTPKVNSSAGRDHWSQSSVALLAGGGLKSGVVVGATDDRGHSPIDSPYAIEDLAATIYSRLGLDLAKPIQTTAGRTVSLDPLGRMISELV